MYKKPNHSGQVSSPTFVLTPKPPQPKPSSQSAKPIGGNSNGREVPAPTKVLTR